MKKGTIWMSLGILLIIAALGLTVYNIWDDKKAEKSSEKAAEDLFEEIIKVAEEPTSITKVYEKYPNIEMPSKVLNGNRYIGILEFPHYSLSLPVISNWSYPNLRVAPCRYEGSPYNGDFIIAAHNYRSHFGILKTLVPGDVVRFMDVDGNLFTYEVASTEILGGTAVEDMKSGEWDLTLFTCTYGGRTRVTVRFVQIDKDVEMNGKL